MVIVIFVNRAHHKYTRDHPQKKIVSKQLVIFRGSPLFLALLGLCWFISIRTLNFGPKLGGTVQTIKKLARMTTDPVQAGITDQ